MARENRKLSFEYALRDEGSNLHTYQGLKKYGIELKVLQDFRAEETAISLAQLDKPRALSIYSKIYWKYPGCDDLASGLDYFIFDSGLVCGGPRAPTTWLGLLAGPYGRSHEETLEYVNSLPLEEAISGLEMYRRRRFRSSPLWPVLGAEWTNRCNRAKRRALALAAGTELEVREAVHA